MHADGGGDVEWARATRYQPIRGLQQRNHRWQIQLACQINDPISVQQRSLLQQRVTLGWAPGDDDLYPGTAQQVREAIVVRRWPFAAAAT